MKKEFTPLMKMLFFIAFFATCLAPTAKASHLLGGQITYVWLGGNQYRITIKLYTDCTGIQPTPDPIEVHRNSTCGPLVATVPVTAAPQVIGQPYCESRFPSGVAPCNNTVPNFREDTYTGTVTLPGNGQFYFTWSQNARPTLENLATAPDLYLFSYVNHLGTTAGLANSSPQFPANDIPIPFVCNRSEFTYSFNANEPDGDQLDYRLDRPYSNCSTTIAYTTNPITTIVWDSTTTPPTPYLPCPTGPTLYSATAPIYSLTRVPPVPPALFGCVVPYFVFDTTTGAATFRPDRWINTPPAQGDNKYIYVVRINEYRNINGVRTLVGWIRREIVVFVENCVNNSTPPKPGVVIPPTFNAGVSTRDSSIVIEAQACNYTDITFNFNTRTSDTRTRYRVFANNPLFPGANDIVIWSLTGNNSNRPVGRMIVAPDISDTGKVFRWTIRVENDDCPIKGVQNYVFELRLVKNNLAFAVSGASNVDTICLGESVVLRGQTRRPDSVPGLPATYVLSWEPAPGLRDADRFNETVVVTPPRTTRYKLRIDALEFANCEDTTSVLVVVNQPIVSNFVSTYPRRANGEAAPAPLAVNFTNISTPLDKVDSAAWSYRRVRRNGLNVEYLSPPFYFSTDKQPSEIILENPGTYEVKLEQFDKVFQPLPNGTVVSRNNCPSEFVDYITIPEPVITNILTRNGDRSNEAFVISGSSDTYALEVFNRWGAKVASYDNYRSEFTGQDLPAGVYFYTLKNKTTKQEFTGWLDLMK